MPNHRISETLKRARHLLIEKGWTQRVAARDARGDPVSVDSPRAACFCVGGAIMAASVKGVDYVEARNHFAHFALSAPGSVSPSVVAAFNDHPGRTREEVIAKLDEAIAAASGSERL